MLISFQAVGFLGLCLNHLCALHVHLRAWHRGGLWDRWMDGWVNGRMDGWVGDEIPLDVERVGDSRV